MGQRTVSIDLAIRGDYVACIFDDGRPHAKQIRFRLTSDSLNGLMTRLRDGLPAGSTITAVMELTGMTLVFGCPLARASRDQSRPSKGTAGSCAASLLE